jgi:hypothetical protein
VNRRATLRRRLRRPPKQRGGSGRRRRVIEHGREFRDLGGEERKVLVLVVKGLRVARPVAEEAVASVAREPGATRCGRERVPQAVDVELDALNDRLASGGLDIGEELVTALLAERLPIAVREEEVVGLRVAADVGLPPGSEPLVEAQLQTSMDRDLSPSVHRLRRREARRIAWPREGPLLSNIEEEDAVLLSVVAHAKRMELAGATIEGQLDSSVRQGPNRDVFAAILADVQSFEQHVLNAANGISTAALDAER